MTTISYEAAVFSRTVSYRNFKGEERNVELQFALDPMKLLSMIAAFEPKKNKKSGNPAAREQPMEFTDEQSIDFVRKIAEKSAGAPSDDGENWEEFEGFTTSLAGQAFLTKLATSEKDREEFATKVILDPFRAFIAFAKADPDNDPSELVQFDTMLSQMENIFADKTKKAETLEDRKARLAAEMAALEASTDE